MKCNSSSAVDSIYQVFSRVNHVCYGKRSHVIDARPIIAKTDPHIQCLWLHVGSYLFTYLHSTTSVCLDVETIWLCTHWIKFASSQRNVMFHFHVSQSCTWVSSGLCTKDSFRICTLTHQIIILTLHVWSGPDALLCLGMLLHGCCILFIVTYLEFLSRFLFFILENFICTSHQKPEEKQTQPLPQHKVEACELVFREVALGL